MESRINLCFISFLFVTQISFFSLELYPLKFRSQLRGALVSIYSFFHSLLFISPVRRVHPLNLC